MLIQPDGRVVLKAGEVIPCQCVSCKHVYQPPAKSRASRCPACGCLTQHDQLWKKVPAKV